MKSVLKCANHDRRDAIGTCLGCGKAICDDCRRSLDDQVYCNDCYPRAASLRHGSHFRFQGASGALLLCALFFVFALLAVPLVWAVLQLLGVLVNLLKGIKVALPLPLIWSALIKAGRDMTSRLVETLRIRPTSVWSEMSGVAILVGTAMSGYAIHQVFVYSPILLAMAIGIVLPVAIGSVKELAGWEALAIQTNSGPE